MNDKPSKPLPKELLDALEGASSPGGRAFSKTATTSPYSNMTFDEAALNRTKRGEWLVRLFRIITDPRFHRYSQTLKEEISQLFFHAIQKNVLLDILDVASATQNEVDSKLKDDPSRPTYNDTVIATLATYFLNLGDTDSKNRQTLSTYDKWKKENERNSPP